MLAGKKIIVGITGSIAAYKSALLVRLLIKEGAEVKVILTQSGSTFITPLTLSTLSKNDVLTTFADEKTGRWSNHVELGLWADLMIIAPLSANTLGKLAHGLCDNLLLATYLSAKCQVMLAPAMDLDMYAHPTTQENLAKCKSWGNIVLHAVHGELASGLHGEGRMAEPEDILTHIQGHFTNQNALYGKKIIITSGPTHERIDAVRFIGNHSSGKMGKSLAEAAANQGATLQFITGPVVSWPQHPNITTHTVTTAEEMLQKVTEFKDWYDIAIFAAAVADFRPKETFSQKRKKEEGGFTIELVENPDIAAAAGLWKKKHQLHVGFALETHDGEKYALMKLQRKKFDLIVLTSLEELGAGFAHETNKITIYDKDGGKKAFELKQKNEVAHDILSYLATTQLTPTL